MWRPIRVSFHINDTLTDLVLRTPAPEICNHWVIQQRTNSCHQAFLFLLLWVVLSSSHFLVLDYSASCMSALFQASPPVQSCVASIQSAHVCWQFSFIQPVVLPRLLCSLGAGSACDTVKGRSQKVARTSTRSPRDAWVILGVLVTELLRCAGSGCRVMSFRRGLTARRLVRRCQGPVGRGVSPQQQASLWSVAGVGCAREDA